MEPPTTPDLAQLAADVALLLDRLLALTVAVAIGGGSLFVASLLLFLRISAAEHRMGERVDASGDRIVRKVNGYISDLDLVPAQDPTPQTSPLSNRPRSRRRI